MWYHNSSGIGAMVMNVMQSQNTARSNDISLVGNVWAIPTYEKGVSSEFCAAKMLKDKGYKILGRRVRTAHGEIDILAQKDGDLIAVEVKQRRTLDYARACVTSRQRKRISNALMFIASERDELFESYRIDVVCFDSVGRFEHIENAFPVEEFMYS
ncbi:MAG: YraN family protein [Holosporales bacterium]|jgi:putative endonuclease|nr:YraN family protein [Holosporales bacterium]